MKRHLYLQVYGATVLISVLSVAAAAGVGKAFADERDIGRLAQGLAQVLLTDVDNANLDQALRRRAEPLGLGLSLYDGDLQLLGSSDATPEPLRLRDPARQLQRFGNRHRHGWNLQLTDGRWLSVRVPHHGPSRVNHLLVLVVLAGCMAIGCYPLARRVTRRLEALQHEVDSLGRGDLGARVEVQGQDEIAALARSFNHAAEQIEGLVAHQGQILASASHELRSPLARLRMAIELMGEDSAGPDTRQRYLESAVADIEELDALVGEILTSARLQHQPELQRSEVAVLDLLAAEAERVGAEVTGTATEVSGDPNLLRRLFRNLFENARKYAGEAAVRATVTVDGRTVVVRVVDAGPGIDPAIRGRVFEPYFRPQGHHEGRDGGVGLGLALARQIAQAHGGDVTLGNPAEGAELVVTLPAGT